jgi:hypothetical protein
MSNELAVAVLGGGEGTDVCGMDWWLGQCFVWVCKHYKPLSAIRAGNVMDLVHLVLGISPASDCVLADVSEPSVRCIFKLSTSSL